MFLIYAVVGHFVSRRLAIYGFLSTKLDRQAVFIRAQFAFLLNAEKHQGQMMSAFFI